MRLRAVLLVPALAVAALAPSFAQESPAQEPGDRVRELCEQGEEQLAAWNVRAAMSAYLRALTVQDEYDGKSGKTARPYLGLASVSLRRGEYWRAVACYDVAARKANLAVKPLAATIDGLAVVFDLVAVSATQPPFSRLGNAFAGVLSPGLHAAFQGIAGSASPAKDAAERWAETILETAQRLADPEHDLVFALAVIDAGRAILAKHAGPDPSADIKKALADLEGKVADYGERAAAAIRAEAARLSIPNSAENVPEHAAFAYRLGETWRLRWRASPGENAPARDAAACYRRCLANEPDHCSAALGLAEVLYRTDRQEQGLETVKMLVDTLLEPSPAWTGAPERPPAPRYDIASSAVDLFTMGLGGGEASPDLDSLSRWADSAALAAYLEHRPSFHPEDAATSRSDLYVRMENNAGFWLLQRWDLTRAAQFLRRSIHLQEQRNATPFPVAWQNLAHLHYLQGDFDRAMECYRNSFQQDPRNPVLANNLGALMGIFGSMTLDIERIREGVQYYRWAVELAPNYVFAKSSEDFMRRVFLTWQRYLHAGDRDPSVVASFGNSFFAAAKSLSESDDPRYLQAMQILDSGLKSMPSDEEMKRIFPELGDGPAAPEDAAVKPDSSTQKMHEIKKDMADRFALCFERGIRQYEGLLARKAAEDPAAGARNPALNFLLGEVYRVGWRRTQSPEHRTKAQQHFAITLAGEPDHAGATRGMVELLRAEGAHDQAVQLAAATVDALLTPERLWEEEVPAPTPQPRIREALELAREIAEFAAAAGGATPPGDGAEKKRWQEFLAETTRKCLEVQRQLAETSLGGQDAEAWNNLGYFHARTFEILRDPKRLEEAMAHLERALELDPVRPGPILNKIHVLHLMGRPQEAESLRAAMRERFPGDSRFAPPPTSTRKL